MSDYDDLTDGLSDDEKAQWLAQFAPQVSAQSPIQPATQTAIDRPDVSLPAIDMSAAADQQRAGTSPITTNPAPVAQYNNQPIPKSTDIDDLKAYADYMSKLAETPATIDKKEEEPSRLGTYRGKDYSLETAASPEGKHGETGGGLEYGEGYIDPYAENARRFAAGLPTLEEEDRNISRANALRISKGLPTLEEEERKRQIENAKRIQSGKKTIEEEKRSGGGGKAILASAIPAPDLKDTMEIGPITVQHPLQAAPQYAPDDPRNPNYLLNVQKEEREAIANQAPTTDAELKAEGQRSYNEEQARAATAEADRDRWRSNEPSPTQTLEPFTMEGQPVAGQPRAPMGYPPAQYIPGKRTPAMWQVQEGNPVPEELQGRMAEANAARQGAIESGRMAGVGGAEANVADLQQRQQAVAALDAQNRQRQLDRQRQMQAETNKLADMVKSIKERPEEFDTTLIPGAAGKFFSAIGQALGAGAAARLGTKNFAAEYVQGRVNEELARQKMQAENDKNKLGAQETLIGQMRKQFGDEDLGDQAAKIALLERAKLHADEVAASSSIPRINANAAALSADLGKQAVQEQIAFQQMARDKVVRRDLMSKGYTVGGPPATGEGEEADSNKVVRLGDYSLAGHAANTDLVLQSPADRKEATSVISAHSAMMSALDQMEALAKAHPWVTYGNVSIPGVGSIVKTREYQHYRKLVETITTLQGELRGQTRMPNQAELEKMYQNWDIGPTNALGGASIEDRVADARAEADRIASAKIKTFAPNVAERGLGVNEKGQVRPVETYTGGTVYTHPMPKGFKPAPNTSGGLQPRQDIAPLDMSHPKVHHITTRVGKGGKKSEDVGPAEREEEDEGEND